MTERDHTVLGLLGGAGAAAVTVAMPWLLPLVRVYGPGGWQGIVLVAVAVSVGLPVGYVALGLLIERPLLLIALFLAVGSLFIAAPQVVANQALAERGRVSRCVVQQEQVRGVMNGLPGHHNPGMFSNQYHYRLRCPGGTPHTMQTSTPAARPGTTLRVIWDPAGRISPGPAGNTAGTRPAIRRVSWVTGSIVALLVLLDIAYLVRKRIRRGG